MAKRSKKKKAALGTPAPVRPETETGHSSWLVQMLLSRFWPPLLLALVAFFAYWPSLQSDFVYDARKEILEEGFLTSWANLPAVLSLKVLAMPLFLGDRPGQLLYLMLIAAVCGKNPFGYHLCSNLLHATNVALLFVLMRRLLACESAGLGKSYFWKIQLGSLAATLIFALHPLAAESVAEVSYSSSLLVTFFTLLTLLAATTFRPENSPSALRSGTLGTLGAFAAVTCKESGLAAALVLVVYWFFFRREERTKPWLLFLSSALAVTALFLAARFSLAPPSQDHFTYLGGSFGQVFLVQPRLWVFMMGQLIWPTQLSADYTLENLAWLSTPVALGILLIVILLQGWLAGKSRLGALGVAIYWLGLVTVSNFIPLYRVVADRFYYLPLAGAAMQLMAVFFLTLRFSRGFWLFLTPCWLGLIPLTLLTVTRQRVFTNNLTLWSRTVEASPYSSIAHNNLGDAYLDKNQLDQAMAQYQEALALSPNSGDIESNIGQVLLKKGEVDEAIMEYRKALNLKPSSAIIQANLAGALLKKGLLDEAIAEFQTSLSVNPNNDAAYNNLGLALFQKGEIDEAIVQYQQALTLDPEFADAHHNLGLALYRAGRTDEAIAQFQKTLAIDPRYEAAHTNLGNALLQKGRVDEAIAQYQETLKIDPDNTHAHNNLGLVLLQKGEVDQAIAQLQDVVRLRPEDANARKTLTDALAQAQRIQASR